MGIRIIWNTGAWKKLLRRTKSTASDVAETARSGAAAVGQKAEDALVYAKLRRAVRDLEEEIALQMQAVGEMVYATHKGNPSDSEELQEILEYVDSLYEQIEGHQRQMKIMQGVLFCGACGAENAATNVYCQECGQPLSRS